MQLKQYYRYVMDYSGKWIKASTMCMAASFFLLAVYYFALRGLASVGFGEAVFCVLLPMVLMVAYVVLTFYYKWNAPGLFALMGMAFCVFLFAGTFVSGNILRIILGVIWYPLSALILIGCAGGYLPRKIPAALIFAVTIFIRFFVFDIGRLGLFSWFLELSAFLCLASMGCLIMSFRELRTRE